jgi:hypothetical protein
MALAPDEEGIAGFQEFFDGDVIIEDVPFSIQNKAVVPVESIRRRLVGSDSDHALGGDRHVAPLVDIGERGPIVGDPRLRVV